MNELGSFMKRGRGLEPRSILRLAALAIVRPAMSRSRLALPLFFLALAGCSGSPATSESPTKPAAAPQPADKVALLVGIARYPADAGLGPLTGCVRDTERVRALLVGRFGFREEDVVVLHDEAATHEAIVRAFDASLIQRARSGTEAVFYFAGHGSRVPDADTGPEREPDGFDTSFLAYDSRSNGRAGEHDFIDDELSSLVAACTSRGAFVTVIADSCHAGGALRGPSNFRARTAQQGIHAFDRAYGQGFWPGAVPYYGDSNRIVMGSSIQIGAASESQFAGEIDVENVFGTFEPTGAMTWTMVNSLERAQPGTTWGDIAQQTALGVATLLPYQDVVWVGDANRAVFGSSFDTTSGWRAVALDAATVQIEAGSLHGIREGSTFDIRTSDARNTYGRAIADRVTSVQSRARFERTPEADLTRVTLRAIEVGRPSGEPPLRLWSEVAGLGPWFAGSPWVTQASSFESADLVVRSGAGGYQLWTPDGLCLPGYLPILPPTWSDQGRWAGVCDPYWRRESMWRATSRLALESGDIQLEVRLDTPNANELRAAVPAGWNRWLPADVRDRRVVGGSGGDLPMGVFRVRNPGRRAVRLSALNLPEDSRSRRVIEPAAGREARVLEPGETYAIRVGFPAPDPWTLDRPMLDRYLFLATTVPFDVWTLASDFELRGDEAPLPGVLRQAQARYAMRGSGPVDLDRSGLGVAAIDVHVLRPRAVGGVALPTPK